MTASGQRYVRYRFDVANKEAYPAAMFAPAPNLPPCGANLNSSRTWVDFFGQDGTRLYGFCALGNPQALGQIWFALPEGQAPPNSVYIVMLDRQTNTRYTSNSTRTSLPNPVLVYTGQEADVATDGQRRVRYRFDVSNKDAYPAAMFVPAPNLPPCGNNHNSSRTWVDFFDQNNTRLYGFCALGNPQALNQIWFALPEGQAPPNSVYILMNDRLTHTTYRSGPANIPH